MARAVSPPTGDSALCVPGLLLWKEGRSEQKRQCTVACPRAQRGSPPPVLLQVPRHAQEKPLDKLRPKFHCKVQGTENSTEGKPVARHAQKGAPRSS